MQGLASLGHPGLELMLGHPQFLKVLQQEATPASSADEADMLKRVCIKSPLAKHDQASAAGTSDSDSEEDSGPAVDQLLPVAAAVEQPLLHLPLPLAVPLPLAEVQPHMQLLQPFCGEVPLPAAAPPQPPPATAAPGAAPEPWLMGLFTVQLFEHHGCRGHPGAVRNGALKRNENNQYCLDCSHVTGAGMCKLCLPGHAACCSGKVFQIRKYMYQTCVHVDDIQPLYDVSGVQAYCINSRRAVLIHPKNVEKEQKCPAFDHTCLGCHKPLRHDCTFCSLRCKVDVEFGLAPITPKGYAAAGAPCSSVDAAVAAALAAATQPRYPPAARPAKRPAVAALPAAVHAAATAAASSHLDVSHATRCSSGIDLSSMRGKRRKGGVPERSHMS